MKNKYKYEYINMGNEIVAVPVGENASQLSGILKLNQEGFDILEILGDDVTEEHIVKILEKKYQDNSISISNYVHNFIEKLRRNELID